MQTNGSNLAPMIRTVRKAARLSQIELAEYADVSRTVIQNIERDETTVSWGNILKILKVLNIKIHLESPLPRNTDEP